MLPESVRDIWLEGTKSDQRTSQQTRVILTQVSAPTPAPADLSMLDAAPVATMPPPPEDASSSAPEAAPVMIIEQEEVLAQVPADAVVAAAPQPEPEQTAAELAVATPLSAPEPLFVPTPPSSPEPLVVALEMSSPLPSGASSSAADQAPPAASAVLTPMVDPEYLGTLEGARLFEAIRLQKMHDEEQLRSRLDEAATSHASELERVKKDFQAAVEARLRELEEQVMRKYSEEGRGRVQGEIRKLRQQFREQLDAARAAAADNAARAAMAASDARLAELRELQAQVEALAAVYHASTANKEENHRAHLVAGAALVLAQQLDSSGPWRDAVAAVAQASEDAVVRSSLKSIPAGVVRGGVATVDQLKDRFSHVRHEAARAALAPPNSGPWGYLLASIAYALKFHDVPTPTTTTAPDLPHVRTDAILERAQHHLASNNLLSAVRDLESLDGVPALIVSDWLAAARQRCVAAQAVTAITSHAAVLAASCS